MTSTPPKAHLAVQLRTREKWTVLEQYWTQAFATGELCVTLPTHKHAMQLRQELYRAAKRAATAKFFNPEVVHAVAACSVTTEDNSVVVYRRTLSPVMEVVKQTVAGNMTGIEESMRRLQELIADPATPSCDSQQSCDSALRVDRPVTLTPQQLIPQAPVQGKKGHGYF